MKSTIKKIRNFLLKKIIWRKYKIGKNFSCGQRVRMWAKNTLEIGDNFYIGRDSFIETNCIIGNNVILANRVSIIGSYDHHYQQIGIPIRLASQIRDKDYNWKGLNQTVIIEDDVWIGCGAIILSGVKIKFGSIIAAGAVVTKDVDSLSIYAGIPAKKVSKRFLNEYDEIQHLKLYKSTLK
jgi:acetyltransferase-like isoleucine patch superfamily enzyme